MVQRAVSGREQAVLAVLCDGMGGLDRGDMASASVVKAFSGWMEKELSRLRWTRKKKIFLALDRVLKKADRRLRAYSGRYDSHGFTAVPGNVLYCARGRQPCL